ncbi:MAG: aminoglycoside phosphotransferase family protein [Clostridia bacterium]|nr:aminoglycoside phosphotransferase family protein [Clostridia bacterium]
MMTQEAFRQITDNFMISGEFMECRPIKDGHINNTFNAVFRNNGREMHYLLQQVNTAVFKNPEQLMINIDLVTSFLRDKIMACGGDPERETLYCKPCRDGKKYYTDEDGRVWRVYNFVNDAESFNTMEDPQLFYKAGYAFGDFQKKLADFPIENLYETIPDFHNTARRYRNLMQSVQKNASGRRSVCEKEIEFARARRDETYILIGKIETGELPVRVTHNDTKINNILFDKKTGEPICIVDLDTVMPGLSLYDFGDAIRSGATTAEEDEADLSKVHFDPALFRKYTEGFLAAAGGSLTKAEIELLPLSAKLMTLECGMRFLTDFIDGDVYFKTQYPEHNLVRCRNQFKLVADMEAQFDEMKQIAAASC